MRRVPFLDLTRQDRELEEELRGDLEDFLRRGRHVLGEEVLAFEEEFSRYCGMAHGVGVASGTDALLLSLRALGAGAGDEVIVPALTAPPTAVAVSLCGARPVFADVDPGTLTIDPASVEERLTPRTRFLIPVHLYGRMADMPGLRELASRRGLVVVEDCAQAHGASLEGRMAGSWGAAGCFSFYPTKNLGAYGDGGLVVTGDPSLARRLRMLRDYGRRDRDTLQEVGLNSRLDELQAAFLRTKLRRLEEWNRRRRELARRYLEGLRDLPLGLPPWTGGDEHCFHLFVVLCREREGLREHLARAGVETAVHYPLPLHLQPPFREGSSRPCPAAERAAREVLSLPLYPYLTDDEQDAVIAAVRSFYQAHRGRS
ncbi:MAG: DegT/DnrJ/EryC1/StrS family aminotransferase [Actinobacteria bacterium]|nr:DegT/DnrJ/EryC1/StrS family aminotransferase [Actinomycetota bacterium]